MAGWWSLGQDLVTGAGLDSWYKTGIHWIGGRWFRTGICQCRKVFAGPELVVAGICWCRKVVAGSGLLVAVSASAGKWSLVSVWLPLVRNWWLLVSAGAGKWTLVSAGAGKWTLVSAGAGRCSLVQNWLLLISAGAGKWPLVSAGAGRWSLVQEGSCWYRIGSC